MFYGVFCFFFFSLQASSVVHALLDLGSLIGHLIVFCCLGLSFHCSLTVFSSNFCFSFLIPYMKVQQAIYSLFLKERLKEEKQQEMVDSPVNMSQVSSHVHYCSRNVIF